MSKHTKPSTPSTPRIKRKDTKRVKSKKTGEKAPSKLASELFGMVLKHLVAMPAEPAPTPTPTPASNRAVGKTDGVGMAQLIVEINEAFAECKKDIRRCQEHSNRLERLYDEMYRSQHTHG